MASLLMLPTTGDQRWIESVALGTSNGTSNPTYTKTEVGKIVALTASDTMAIAASGADIEGFIDSTEPGTVNNGFSYGGVQRAGRMQVWLATAAAIGTYVVAGTQEAIGTALVNGYPNVIAGAGVHFKWRVISGTGLINSVAVIERVN